MGDNHIGPPYLRRNLLSYLKVIQEPCFTICNRWTVEQELKIAIDSKKVDSARYRSVAMVCLMIVIGNILLTPNVFC